MINVVVRSGFFQTRTLTKVKPFLLFYDFERVMHAFVSSRLDYCNSMYVGINQSTLSRLQIVQNAAAILLTGSQKRDHITPILFYIGYQSVIGLILRFCCLFFKSLNGLAPPYFSDLLQSYSPSRSLRSADQKLLTVPRAKRKLWGDHAFSQNILKCSGQHL